MPKLRTLQRLHLKYQVRKNNKQRENVYQQVMKDKMKRLNEWKSLTMNQTFKVFAQK